MKLTTKQKNNRTLNTTASFSFLCPSLYSPRGLQHNHKHVKTLYHLSVNSCSPQHSTWLQDEVHYRTDSWLFRPIRRI